MTLQKRERARPVVRATAPALGLVSMAGASALSMTLCTNPAAAQAPAGGNAAAEDPAESRSAAFQAVDPNAKKEDVPGGPLLVAAYGVILVLLVAYVARLGALYAKNRGELERLVRAVERGGRKD